jgi:hypothetical protein
MTNAGGTGDEPSSESLALETWVMDVRIGVIQTAKEIDIELADDADPAKIAADVEAALKDDDNVLWLTDRKGRRFAVPSSKVAYVEIGAPGEARRVGFGAT